MSFAIRAFQLDELSHITRLAHEIWPHTFAEILSPKQIDYMLKWMYSSSTLQDQFQNGHMFYGIEIEGEWVGFMGLEAKYPQDDSIKIHKLYVLPALQGKGIGRKLIDYAIDVARTAGYNQLMLNVNRFNKAVRFYEHLGFSILKQEDISIGEGYLMEDYVMVLAV